MKIAVVLTFLSSTLLVLGFPPHNIWPLEFIGLIPLFMALERVRGFKQAFIIGLIQMIWFGVFGFSWISYVATEFGGLPWIVSKFIVLLFALIGEAQFLFFVLFLYRMKEWIRSLQVNEKRLKQILFFFWIIAVPFFYTGLDLLYPKLFPSTLGQSFYKWFEIAQLSEFLGVYSLTVPIVMTNVVLFFLLNLQAKQSKEKLSRLALGVMALVLVLFFSGGHFWGRKRIAELDALEMSFTKKIRFAAIQANIGDLDKLASEKGFAPAVDKVLGTYSRLSKDAVLLEKPDLLIWPETAFPFMYYHLGNAHSEGLGVSRDNFIAKLVEELNVPFYFGSYSQSGGLDYNTAFLILPPYDLRGIYQKTMLLAFGEYLPLGPLNGPIRNLIPSIANFGRGPGPITLKLHDTLFSPQICYEGIFPEFSLEATRKGARFYLNITNDSWFGPTPETELHLLLTVFRSIENRRPMIRSTNTGISTYIDYTGRMRGRTDLFQERVLRDDVRLPSSIEPKLDTFFTKSNGLFNVLCKWFSFGLILVLGSFLRKDYLSFRASRLG